MSDTEYKPVSIGNWILTFILLGIPLVNLIMLVIWAFGSGTHPSKKTFAQAQFVLFVIAICIAIALALLLPLLGYHLHPSSPAV
ncbi:MAG TPA: hypothetical protein VMH87_15275 [Pseudomonadales bacterium]|nr:hypothetical protein [Pseudomonadales bacterium]